LALSTRKGTGYYKVRRSKACGIGDTTFTTDRRPASKKCSTPTGSATRTSWGLQSSGCPKPCDTRARVRSEIRCCGARATDCIPAYPLITEVLGSVSYKTSALEFNALMKGRRGENGGVTFCHQTAALTSRRHGCSGYPLVGWSRHLPASLRGGKTAIRRRVWVPCH
jgi:hypothetical protein